ncbi:recombination mediator RecR [Brachyspira pilosicoli]|uniref:Recombination protein RecR n=3 Tax=Brachyspira pilosicoli TaxID=52584 RepID=D8IB07_BRAP9|nr:recombination mediator RecR [Brachyspira pilosicoli]ADK30330.1 recombination protein, RecR [Brachyspira pilosicoli 95/1000]AFR70971.1 recombination protein RecR [Brachyspira pilosicoli B2904]MBW5378761.1 recombination protein RecR [Brachyspira pilosicoli]MBW5382819.1 recombination protein RecR [Brachyspira pilosicoli]MBW5391927.1 recombination protein RecR [Brachyspira pilosicoli]
MSGIDSLDKLTQMIARLPGIGGRSAMRIALYLFDSDDEYLSELSNSILSLHKNIKLCRECYSLSENDICNICASDKRDRTKLCIVESYTDMIAIEKTEEYNGIYHVLGGLIEPLKGIGISDIRIKELIDRVKDNSSIEEIIIAFGASLEADTTASYINKTLRNNNFDKKISRITYGISLASDIENADSRSLARSIADRVVMQ